MRRGRCAATSVSCVTAGSSSRSPKQKTRACPIESAVLNYGARHDAQTSGNLAASHFANAAFTATGLSCAIQ